MARHSAKNVSHRSKVSPDPHSSGGVNNNVVTYCHQDGCHIQAHDPECRIYHEDIDFVMIITKD
jgi:hypothetical protein